MTTQKDIDFLVSSMKDWPLSGRPSAEVYDEYKAACKKANIKPLEKHEFSRNVCSVFCYRTENKYVPRLKAVVRCFAR